ncbi:putative ribonuclease H-like domain-containing protein [Tanacetum coccineum]
MIRAGNFMPPKPDLVYPSLDDFVDVNESVSEPVVEKPTVETNEPKTAWKENGAPIIEDWVSECEEENEPKFQTVKPNFTKIEFVKPKTNRKPVEQIRQDTSRSPRGNKRNWNQQMSQKLGNEFEMFKKACHVCGGFDHLKNDCKNWYNNRRSAKPVWTNVQKVNTVMGTRDNTARPKAVFSAVKGNKGNAVKASACWVWKPKHKVLDHVSRNNGASMSFKRFDYIYALGRSKHMIGNISYLTNYEEIDGGFVAFGGNFKGGKITRKDFKLTDESHVLLKVPRKDNMYSVELKNVVPQGGLTCLFEKATPDESNLWHRRLGHQKGNKTLIEAAKTMLADLKLPTKFWAEAVNTACYVQNRVLVIKPHNKTPYELFLGRKPALSFMRPFGCPVTILNTIDHLGKFDEKADEGFFVGYSTNSKAFRVFNSRTRIVEENLHVQFSENTPNIAGSGPNWLFDIDALTKSMNYKPIVTGNQSNGSAGTKPCDNVGKAIVETEEKKDVEDPGNEDSEVSSTEEPRVNQEKDANVNNTNNINTVSPTDNVAGIEDNVVNENIVYRCADDLNMPELEDIVCSGDDEDVNAEADMNNLDTFMPVSPIPTTRIHKDHHVEQIIRDLNSAPQTRRMTKNLEAQGEPKKSYLMEKELSELNGSLETKRIKEMDVKSAFLYGKIEEEVYVCQPLGFEDPDFPDRVYKVEKALYRLYQAPRAWYETLSTYLLDNGFQRGKIDKTLFIKRDKSNMLLVQVYVDYIIFGSTKKEMCTEFEKMMHKKFQMSSMGELSFFLSLTPMETHKTLLKNEKEEDVDEHLYRSKIGSLVYLNSLRPDIIFAVCACARFQANPKISHLHAVKRIFRYLKGQPKFGHWYPKDLPFDLVAYTDSDYAGASLDRKSITRGCQFLGCRLISWQCKKQIVVANSTTEAKYISASNCCGRELWIQNQLLDYG